MKKKAVVAGHICLDITPKFPRELTGKVDQILIPSKLLHMNGVEVATGGVVANTGLAMKILGADVSLMGKLGDDEFGKLVMEVLKKYNAKDSAKMAVTKDQGTSYSVVIAIPGIDRIFLHDPGANDSFGYDDVDFEAVKEAALFHFGYPPLMKKMYENNGSELVRIFKKVKEMGVATALDFTVVDPHSPAGQTDWYQLVSDIVPYVDFLVPSAEEICYMIDRPRYDSWMERAGGGDVTEILDIDQDIRPLAQQLLSMGARVVMIKCGAPGIYYRTADEETLKGIGAALDLDIKNWADKEGFQKSFRPEAVRSGTGAGDTCIAAFFTSMLDGKSIEKCAQLAVATGTCCVEAYDALSGLKTFDELEAKIAGGWV